MSQLKPEIYTPISRTNLERDPNETPIKFFQKISAKSKNEG
ncbi:hypothetical protein HNQ03_003098 [Chryseobacterium sp. 16F]|uniref:Uncharacterized protein n=1 Tax=Frigoriflavimonas asaccharolytica TaxID=2735899 RepID=A0A8J8G9L0_9FLAO|nr:hypothetical protein [Frigoriflavimonas asaccharolytica]